MQNWGMIKTHICSIVNMSQKFHGWLDILAFGAQTKKASQLCVNVPKSHFPLPLNALSLKVGKQVMCGIGFVKQPSMPFRIY